MEELMKHRHEGSTHKDTAW